MVPKTEEGSRVHAYVYRSGELLMVKRGFGGHFWGGHREKAGRLIDRDSPDLGD